ARPTLSPNTTLFRSVQGEALGGFADVLVGNERGQIDTELGIPFVDDRLTAQLADRLFEHLRVRVEADGRDGAALPGAEELAGAADRKSTRLNSSHVK